MSSSSPPVPEDLVIPQHFTYQYFVSNRYQISEETNYEALCNNGFVKLYHKMGRVYWHTQNEFGHEVPDWKFHVSVSHKDIPIAWNLLAALFLKMECRSGMKTIYLKEAQNPVTGREITIYLIKYDPQFEQSQFAGDFGLSIAVEHSEDYWLLMCRKIEAYLASYGIESNGLAEGDHPLGKYLSFRNEAFVRTPRGDSIYPPDSYGWNPLGQSLPIDLPRFEALMSGKEEKRG